MANKQNSEVEIACLKLEILPVKARLRDARHQLRIAVTSDYKIHCMKHIAELLREIDPNLQRIQELQGDSNNDKL